MKTALVNILTQAIKPSRFRVMAGKIVSRLLESNSKKAYQENLDWIEINLESYESYALSFDEPLWLESKDIGKDIASRAKEILNEIEYDLGGGGIYTFLYFITRYIQPKFVVETGVAAGFSSYSILAALERNKSGKLLSSDFPYFRLPNPESYIGVIVPDHLKENWTLMIEGDEKNLPKITNNVEEINLFHYDSDKSYRGRKRALSLISKKLSTSTIILMDDIQDNSHFRDFTQGFKREDWRVFEFSGKYVGMIGKLV